MEGSAFDPVARTHPDDFTFLFSDIEGSTRLLRALGDGAPSVIARHHAILRDAITRHGGTVVRVEGDAFLAVFGSPAAAVAAAVEAQRGLDAEPWPVDDGVRVRMGIHTGPATVTGGEYVGLEVHRAARIMSVGWGGQILISDVAAGHLHDGAVTLRDLGAHRLKDFDDPVRLHQVVAAGLRGEFPALRSLDAVTRVLPTPLTSFVGREDEVAEIAALLATHRLVTLTGPGGTGKTRLAMAVAETVADRGDGVFFVALASVSDPPLVLSTVAGVLGLATAGSRTPLEVVTEHLQHRTDLLVLDNFEQVLAAAPEIGRLLAAAPGVTVLVTSRAPLRLAGEQEYPVSPLSLPAAAVATAADLASSEAAMLFATRAAAVLPDFRLTDEVAPAVAEIIRRTDGLPLAIELAASRVRVLPVTAIAGRLGAALDLLSSGARDLPDRQRTLRGAIAWSYDLLGPPARTLFARASVFRGGAGLDHLEAVCGPGIDDDVLELVTELVDHSLVRRAEGPDARYVMLETIREFAAECLVRAGERDDLRRRHAATFLALAEEAAPHLTGPEAGTWLDLLEAEHDNLRAALRRSMADGEAATALRLVVACWRLWQIRGHLHEARRNVDAILALPRLDEHPREAAAAFEAAGGIAYWQADLSASRVWYEEALRRYRDLGDEHAVARGLYNLGFAYGLEEPASARTVFQQAIDAYTGLGDEIGLATAHWGMSVAAMWGRDYEALVDHADRSIPVFRAAGRTFDLAWALHLRGLGELAFKRLDVARSLFEECLRMFLASQDASGYYLALSDFAFLAEAQGEDERALRLIGAVQRLGEEIGTGLLEPQTEWVPRHRRSEQALPPDAVAALQEEGRALTLEQAIAYALEG